MNILAKASKKLSTQASSLAVRCFSTTPKHKHGTESLAVEPEDDLYLTKLKNEFNEIYSTNYKTKIPGHATPQDTKSYSLRGKLGEIFAAGQLA